jgi:hypothetical protein
VKINLIAASFFLLATQACAQEKLIFAIDLVRHGDRTPTIEIPKSPLSQPIGELTSEGKEQERQLGIALRKKYVDQYQLLPANYSSQTVYARSTDMSRTIESAKALLDGLYPDTQITINTVIKSKDYLLVVKPSRNIFSLLKLYWVTHQAWKEKTNSIQDKISRWSQATGLKLNDFQDIIALADNLYVRQQHHLPMPKGVSSQDADEIISLGDWAISEGFKLPAISHPMGANFISTAADYFQQAKEKTTSLKCALFLAHDSSIMAVMNTLGAPLNHNPRYASDLNFSFFEKDKNYFVKIYFNNNPVVIPRCKNSNVCTLDQFVSLSSF